MATHRAAQQGDREGAAVPTVAVVAVGAPILVAVALLPLRGDISSANVALVLVLVVLAGAIVGGRPGGIAAALTSTLLFDVLYTRPYGSLRIATRDDVETTLLLLGVGLVAGELVVRVRRSTRAAVTSRAEIVRMRRLAELAAGSDSAGRAIESVRQELLLVLPLETCWFERPPFPTTMPQLRHGRVTFPSRDRDVAMLDPTLSRLFEVPVCGRGRTEGRFVLEFADPSTVLAVPAEARATAVALADQLGVTLAGPHGDA